MDVADVHKLETHYVESIVSYTWLGYGQTVDIQDSRGNRKQTDYLNEKEIGCVNLRQKR